MNNKALKNRSEIPAEFKWDIEAMYPVEDDVTKDIEEALAQASSLSEYQGKIMESPATLLSVLDLYSKSMQKIEKAYIYSHMKHDEDNADSKYNKLYGKAMSAVATFSANTSFLTPELLSYDEDKVLSYIDKEEGLSKYRFMLEKILREKPHVLSSEQEYIIASLSEVMNAPDEIFTALNDVDMVFGEVRNEDGEIVPLTHASYSALIQSPSREVREETFTKLYKIGRAHV